jgi:hypothetical protein
MGATRRRLPLIDVKVEVGHGRMSRGGHGLRKVSPGLAMPYPSTPCGQATPETRKPFLRWPAAVYHFSGHPTPYAYGVEGEEKERM